MLDRDALLGQWHRVLKSTVAGPGPDLTSRQLALLLREEGFSSSTIDIRDVDDLLHLKSGVAYLGDRRLVAAEQLAKLERFPGYELTPVAAGQSAWPSWS